MQFFSERKSTHGDFGDVSQISDDLRRIAEISPNWKKLSPRLRTIIIYILGKIARILCGDPNFDDHWIDIIGYANLRKSSIEIEQ